MDVPLPHFSSFRRSRDWEINVLGSGCAVNTLDLDQAGARVGDVTRALVAQVTSPMVIVVSPNCSRWSVGVAQAVEGFRKSRGNARFETRRSGSRWNGKGARSALRHLSYALSLFPLGVRCDFEVRDRNDLLDVYCRKVSTISRQYRKVQQRGNSHL
jgi:hypothetical protein